MDRVPGDLLVKVCDIVQESVIKTIPKKGKKKKKKKKKNGKVIRPYKDLSRAKKLNKKGKRKTIHI